jgi:uncharacterized protein YsxB (DUF464 family)
VIQIEFAVDGQCLSCNITGHANAARAGSDIVCAAVSVLVRTAELTLRGKEGLDLQVRAAKRGDFFLEASIANESVHTNGSAENRIFLKAVGEYLQNGLSSVAAEFPNNCSIRIKTLA